MKSPVPAGAGRRLYPIEAFSKPKTLCVVFCANSGGIVGRPRLLGAPAGLRLAALQVLAQRGLQPLLAERLF